MATIRRLTHSCLTVTTDAGTALLDPGFPTWEAVAIRDTIGDVQQVLLTHEHIDHVHPGFVRWLRDRGSDVVVHGNDAVAALLADEDVEVRTDVPDGLSVEDVAHGTLPDGSAPPNRVFTLEGTLTHAGDSFDLTATAPVLALPLMAPWGTVTDAVATARRLRPQVLLPIHDFYLSAEGRAFVSGIAERFLEAKGVRVHALEPGESMTV